MRVTMRVNRELRWLFWRLSTVIHRHRTICVKEWQVNFKKKLVWGKMTTMLWGNNTHNTVRWNSHSSFYNVHVYLLAYFEASQHVQWDIFKVLQDLKVIKFVIFIYNNFPFKGEILPYICLFSIKMGIFRPPNLVQNSLLFHIDNALLILNEKNSACCAATGHDYKTVCIAFTIVLKRKTLSFVKWKLLQQLRQKSQSLKQAP